MATVIVNIGLDHTALLGDTIERIAAQKAGIAKPGVPMVVYPGLPGAARAVIENTCRAIGAPVLPAGQVAAAQEQDGLAPRFAFETENGSVGPVALPLLGAHQQKNAQTALCALDAVAPRFPVTNRQKEQGLAQTCWPGRMQWLPGCQDGVSTLIDGAHNPQAAAYLRQNVRALFGGVPVVLLCAVMKDKNTTAVVKELDAMADETICTVAETERGMPAERLATLFSGPVRAIGDPFKAYQKARETARDKGALLVVAGSLYLPGAIGLENEKERG